MKQLKLSVIALFFSAYFIAGNLAAAPVYTFVGQASNNTNPSTWLNFSYDITSLISGAGNAELTFDLRNDGPPFSASLTVSDILFGVEGTDYFVHFDYAAGGDTSHWRNVQLNIDGVNFVDQYGLFNNHLGDDILGTAQQGSEAFSPASNILGETGYDSTTYIMSAVPLPGALWLFTSGLFGLLTLVRHRFVI